MAKGTCSIEGCERPMKRRVWCEPHYHRWVRYGDPLGRGVDEGAPLAWLIQALADPPDGCLTGWPFAVTGSAQRRPAMHYDGRTQPVTHVVLAMTGSPRPPAPGNHALHSCDNPECINPRHLRWGTTQDNVADAVERGRLARGEQNPVARLTDEAVRAIRASDATVSELAATFGVSRRAIRFARDGLTWRHVA